MRAASRLRFGCLGGVKTPRRDQLTRNELMKGTVPPVGQVFERLTVLGPGVRKYHWLCQCSCGNIKEINKFHIGKGVKSCGCILKEWSTEGQKTHGKRRTKTYEIWASLKQRCLNPNNKCFEHYGGRGIEISQEWMKYENFLADMGECPAGYSIERIDVNKGYYRENCKWIEKSMQNRNKRNNRLLSLNGKEQAAIKWAEELGIPYGTMKSRIRYGWTDEEILTIPVKSRKKEA